MMYKNSAIFFLSRFLSSKNGKSNIVDQDLSFSACDDDAGPAGHVVTLPGMLAVPARHEAAQPRVLLSLHPRRQTPLLLLHLFGNGRRAFVGQLGVPLLGELLEKLQQFRRQGGGSCLLFAVLGFISLPVGFFRLVEAVDCCADFSAEFLGHWFARLQHSQGTNHTQRVD